MDTSARSAYASRLRRFTVAGAVLGALLPGPAFAAAQLQPPLSAQDIADIQKDTSRHFGDAPEDPGLKATDLSTGMNPTAVRAALRKVADWQLARSQPYFARIWTWSVLYTGFMAASRSLPEPRGPIQGSAQQNIEYTQYMPGSLHANDRGKHLGPNRISLQMIGASIGMQDPREAEAFYQKKLGFRAIRDHVTANTVTLKLPGSSGEVIQIAPDSANASGILFAEPNLKQASQRLNALHLPIHSEKAGVWVLDPDGNRICFVYREFD